MNKFNKSLLKVVVCIVAIVAIISGALSEKLKTVFYTVKTENIDENVRIALIADFHSCKYGENEEVLIGAIEKQKPDIVLMAGDIFDDKMPIENTEILLQGIADKYPCYYVTGNHEYWSGDIEGILNLLKKYGVTVLNGECKNIVINGQKINLCGITDQDAIKYTSEKRDYIQQLEEFKNVHENGSYTILMAHRPEYIETYAKYNFDMVLSGHAHGGQWRIPLILNGLYSYGEGFFPKYAGGEYTVEDTKLIVSRGLATTTTLIPRIFNRPELVIIDLK